MNEHNMNKHNCVADAGASDTACSNAAAAITRGVCRMLRAQGYEVLREFKLTSRRRADIAGLDRNGGFVIVEVKSSLADFRADGKWPEYIPHCDAFYFAVDGTFPLDVLPGDQGLIVADAFDGVIRRPAPERRMNGNRRRAQIQYFARQAARHLERLIDPGHNASHQP